MVKQSLIQTCLCRQAINFPEGEIKTKCKTKGCGAHWECGVEGFWSIAYWLTPIFAKPNHYQKYMGWRAKNTRKAGRKC